jgi:hypothetical protein
MWSAADLAIDAGRGKAASAHSGTRVGDRHVLLPGSGDRIAIAAYLGGSDTFDHAIADFAETYADQNQADYAALQAAVKEGRVQATTDI